ncbi:MAG: hypothetical protein M0Z40_17820 [Actinomycetota bacterium]|nr:hypothetical protein [Actinomycetota bacterium]
MCLPARHDPRGGPVPGHPRGTGALAPRAPAVLESGSQTVSDDVTIVFALS